MSYLALLALAGLLTLAGSGLLRRFGSPDRGAAHHLVFSFLAGALAWHLLLQVLTLAGVPWKRSFLAVGLVGMAWLCRRGARPASLRHASLPTRAGWGDGVAALTVLVFALLAPTLWITTPDFVYHWGLKGEHAFLARGIDYAWLAQPWNWSLHPDYPHLLPLLYGSTARLALRFDAPSLQLWSAFFLGGIVLAARAVLGQAGVSRGAVQGGMALVGMAAAAYSVGYLFAGGADGMIALALAAALPALLAPIAPAGPAADLEIGIAAGFAAAAKIEGVPLAAFLVGVHLLRRLRGGLLAGQSGLRKAGIAFLAAGGPALAVALPWFVQAHRYHLFQAGNSGPFDGRRGRVILPAMLDALRAPELHHLPWAVALLPLLWLARRTRPAAAVVSAQLGFYFWAYFASLLEPRFYVLSNFARLLFHLLPAVLVGAVVAVARRAGPEPQ
ncbi:MAG TPA: hypothetical protein VGR07_08880 [Thermoanaerobaculia bacterium]|nr:hypothetical protein [Thermoanaerobaculia bacterium]